MTQHLKNGPASPIWITMPVQIKVMLVSPSSSQETLTFEQAVAYLDTYSEPEADEQCIIIGFLLDIVDVGTAVEICAMQTVYK